MKKNLSIIVVTIISLLFLSKENYSQSIELPDFVITGVQSVSIPTMKKNKSEYIPVISDEFLTPTYDPEDFTLTDYTSPIKKELELYKEPHGYNGLLKVGVGTLTLPIGNLYFNKSIGQFLFDTHIWGLNVREYIPNAGYNTSGGKVNFNYFINKRNLMFHGLSIKLDATFAREGYKLYGSISPTAARENNFQKFNLSFINRLKKTLNYGLKISGRNVNLTKDDVKENRYDWNLFLKYDFGLFALGFDGLIISQDVIKLNGILNKYSYFGGNAFVKFDRSDVFYAKAGVHYSGQGPNSFFSPFGDVSFFVTRDVSIFASYYGGTEFLTVNNFIATNRYYKAADVDNVFQRTSLKLSGAIKYEYERLLEINGGVAFSKLNSYLYFEDNLVDGIFDVNLINDVDRVALFFNITFNTPLYGKLYANVEMQDVKNSVGKKLPYTPTFTASFSYTYSFTNDLLSKTEFKYFEGNYANLENTLKLPGYFNMSIYLRYNITQPLAVTATIDNLLNNNNYVYKNYREKPFDVIFGVEYNW